MSTSDRTSTRVATKGEETRLRILERAAPLLNRHGFQNAPVSEIMRVTGLQKGGLYNHFASKEELSLAAFDLIMERVLARVLETHRRHTSPLAQLIAHIEFIGHGHTAMEGGCPIANSMVESDDANPALRTRVKGVLERWRRFIAQIVAEGVVKGEIRADVNPDEVATNVIGTLEGGQLLSQFYGDDSYRRRLTEQLLTYVNEKLRATP
jgi:TetR/AcrR family transcriptional regulator, transcriptional repressor for nem operon